MSTKMPTHGLATDAHMHGWVNRLHTIRHPTPFRHARMLSLWSTHTHTLEHAQHKQNTFQTTVQLARQDANGKAPEGYDQQRVEPGLDAWSDTRPSALARTPHKQLARTPICSYTDTHAHTETHTETLATPTSIWA